MARSTAGRRLLLLLGTLLVLFVAAEIGARWYIENRADEDTLKRYASIGQLAAHKKARLSPHRYIGYYPTPDYVDGDNKHNSLGFRGEEITLPKPPGEYRIACLGGSTTYSTSIPAARHAYPALLERFLRESGHEAVTVVNAGGPGWSTWESLISFQLRVLDLQPDMIIVYHAINDVDPRLVWPPTAYRGDNSGRRAPVDTIFMPNILEYSTVLRWLLVDLGWAIPHSEYTAILNKGTPSFHGDAFRVQFANGTYPEGIFAEVPAARMLAVNQPIYFRRNIENMVAIAERHGIEVVLATFSVSPIYPHLPMTSSPEFQAAIAEHNQILVDVAANTVAHLFDFDAVMPKDKEYWFDGCHVSKEGVVAKARLFQQYLDDAGLVP